MKLLNNLEITKVSGGVFNKEEALPIIGQDSLLVGILGSAISAVYAICTNTTVATTVGNTLTIASSFPSVFWMGTGVSWVAGLGIGLGHAIYKAEFAGTN